jgi:hypothetical protein
MIFLPKLIDDCGGQRFYGYDLFVLDSQRNTLVLFILIRSVSKSSLG